MIHFFTFGDNNFKKSKKRLLVQAKKFGFQKIYSFSPKDLTKEFIEKTNPYIKQKRGGGYWIWKPFFLKQIFDKINDDDILLYLDAGFELNLNGVNRFNEYIKFMDENKGVFSFHIPNCFEYEYTNEKTLNHFDIHYDSKIYNSEQLVGGIIFLRKNQLTSELVNEYFQTAINFPYLFSDDFDWGVNEKYKEHRHDQSIFSILRKKMNISSIADESWSSDWCELNDKPFLAKRIRDISIFKKIFSIIKKFLTS